MMNPGEKQLSEGKRPRPLPSGVHGIASSFEPWIRRVVSEEIEHALSRVLPSQQIIFGSSAKKFRLEFQTNPAATSFTENDLEAEQYGDTIRVMLVDAVTGQPVTAGPESAATLDVVPLLGDFKTSEEHEWSTEEFEGNLAKERAGKGPLLVGDLQVKLENGVGSLGQMYFADNSRSTRSKTFRLGVRVAQDNERGLMSIQEGKSQAFAVKDKRGKSYVKHDTPSPTDEVWRLQNIRKGGPFHTKLEGNGIYTVQDFLSRLQTRPEDLKTVMCNMPEKMYQSTINHAKKCILGDNLYMPPYKSLIFSPENQLMDAVMQGRYVSLEMVPDTAKVHLDGLVECAYDHWETDVTECDPAEIIDYVELENAMDSQGFAIESLSEDMHRQLEGLRRSTSQEEVASQVQERGGHFELLSVGDPGPAGGRLWLCIRIVIRCTLFMRRAGLARSF